MQNFLPTFFVSFTLQLNSMHHKVKVLNIFEIAEIVTKQLDFKFISLPRIRDVAKKLFLETLLFFHLYNVVAVLHYSDFQLPSLTIIISASPAQMENKFNIPK